MKPRMLLLAAAVAIPATAFAGGTAIVGSAVAGAAKAPPVTTDCAITGLVTFTPPGLSYDGSLTKKSSVDTSADVTPSGTCGTSEVKAKIVSTTDSCASPPSGQSAAPVCADQTKKSGGNYYDSASSFTSDGTSSIVSSLGPKGLKAEDNGNKVTLDVTSGGTSEVYPGGACGSAAGFALSGDTSYSGLTYTLDICLTGDTGANTTDNFVNDLLSADGGGDPVIATATVGGSSTLDFTYSG